MDTVISHHPTINGNQQLCQNYRTISISSHTSKVMLKVTLNRLRPQAGAIIAEEQARFRAGRSSGELIFNLRVLCEKYEHCQQHLYHVFIYFKKAFDRVWHATLWDTMKKCNISHDLLCSIKVYTAMQPARFSILDCTQWIFHNGEWFKKSVVE